MNKIFFISIIEAIYIYYMWNIFKTEKSFHNPLEIIIQKKNIYNFVQHPISNGIYESKICPLGNLVSKILVIWIFLRLFLNKKIMLKYNKIIFITLFVCSLILNMNSFIYYIPIYLYEFYFFPYN